MSVVREQNGQISSAHATQDALKNVISAFQNSVTTTLYIDNFRDQRPPNTDIKDTSGYSLTTKLENGILTAEGKVPGSQQIYRTFTRFKDFELIVDVFSLSKVMTATCT